MDRKPNDKTYRRPELVFLGSMADLTTQVIEKCTGSADATLPREVPTAGDFFCGPSDQSTGPI